MNKIKRRMLKEIAEKLQNLEELRDEILDDLQRVIDDEQESYDNLPESIQDSERGEQMQEYLDTLNDVLSEIESMDCDAAQWADTLSDI